LAVSFVTTLLTGSLVLRRRETRRQRFETIIVQQRRPAVSPLVIATERDVRLGRHPVP
jgi:hypothetical protein